MPTYLVPAVAGAVAFLLGWLLHKMLVNKEIGGATAEAERILAETRRESETLRKEMVLEGREQISEERSRELEKLREKQSVLDRRENDITRLSQQMDRTRRNPSHSRKPPWERWNRLFWPSISGPISFWRNRTQGWRR